MTYETKDSGERAQFDSGMQRDTEGGKPRFDLTWPKGVPFEEQLLVRFARLMGRGAEKYAERNWEQADSEAEMDRMKSSAFRHFMQWYAGQTDEDHAAAVMFNLMAFEATKYKLASAEEDADCIAGQEDVVSTWKQYEPDGVQRSFDRLVGSENGKRHVRRVGLGTGEARLYDL